MACLPRVLAASRDDHNPTTNVFGWQFFGFQLFLIRHHLQMLILQLHKRILVGDSLVALN